MGHNIFRESGSRWFISTDLGSSQFARVDLVLGIPGLILGIVGIRNVKKHIATNMKVAITGVALSFLSLAYAIFLAANIIWLSFEDDKCDDTAQYPSEAENQACFEQVWT